MAKQKQLGIAAAALTQAVELVIAKENYTMHVGSYEYVTVITQKQRREAGL